MIGITNKHIQPLLTPKFHLLSPLLGNHNQGLIIPMAQREKTFIKPSYRVNKRKKEGGIRSKYDLGTHSHAFPSQTPGVLGKYGGNDSTPLPILFHTSIFEASSPSSSYTLHPLPFLSVYTLLRPLNRLANGYLLSYWAVPQLSDKFRSE